MSLFSTMAPLVAGLLVGINPYTAHYLRARLDERAGWQHVLIEASVIIILLATILGVAAWEFAPFVSGRLTNGLLLLGLLTLAGAVYAQRPVGRHRGSAPAPPQGWRWLARYASDAVYFIGPAWLVATAIAMRAIRATAFALPYALAALGAILAITAWLRFAPERLPVAPPRPGEPITRTTRVLGVAYGAAGALVLAGNVGLL